jgi:hypothetical protein
VIRKPVGAAPARECLYVIHHGERLLAIAEQHRVDGTDFERRTAPLLGLPITHPWRGYGSALFLELGPLKRVRRVRRAGHSLKGLAGVMIEWSWRVERPRSIEFGSWSADRTIDSGIRGLKRARVESVRVEGQLPELCLTLSDGRRVRSFMSSDGQPRWVLFLPDGSWLCVRRGVMLIRYPA